MQEENMPEDIARSLVTERQRQIMGFGCPTCGSAYDFIISDTEGISFRCQNEACPSGRPRVEEEKAEKQCPKSQECIMAVAAAKEAIRQFRQCSLEIRYFRDKIRYLCDGSCSQQNYMMKCKDAYRKVRDLCLFDKEGARIYSIANPFVLEHPDSGKLISIYNIGQKRRNKAMLSALWWGAKEKFNKTLRDIAKYRSELKGRKSIIKARETEAQSKAEAAREALQKANITVGFLGDAT